MDKDGYVSAINYAYNTGNIQGSLRAGGIVAYIDFCSSGDTDRLKYIYNIGTVNTSTSNYGALYGVIVRLCLQTEAYYLKGSCSRAGSFGFGASGNQPIELEENEMMKLEEFISNYMTY